MEDINAIAADCIVISCCCQCLILQLLIFILLKLPNKLFRKTRQYAKKLRDRKRREKTLHIRRTRYDDDSLRRCHEGSFRFNNMGGFLVDGSHSFGHCCMDEIEKVLEEFSIRGEFALEAFWDGEPSSRSPSCLVNKEIDYDVHCHLIQMCGSFNCREQPWMH